MPLRSARACGPRSSDRIAAAEHGERTERLERGRAARRSGPARGPGAAATAALQPAVARRPAACRMLASRRPGSNVSSWRRSSCRAARSRPDSCARMPLPQAACVSSATCRPRMASRLGSPRAPGRAVERCARGGSARWIRARIAASRRSAMRSMRRAELVLAPRRRSPRPPTASARARRRRSRRS